VKYERRHIAIVEERNEGKTGVASPRLILVVPVLSNTTTPNTHIRASNKTLPPSPSQYSTVIMWRYEYLDQNAKYERRQAEREEKIKD
jgi:hypothetical protein